MPLTSCNHNRFYLIGIADGPAVYMALLAVTVLAMDLAEEVRTRIRSGRLPTADSYRVFGVKGDGSVCACCDRAITDAEIQFDVECHIANSGWSPFSMHLNCFHTWRNASAPLMPRAPDSGALEDRTLDAAR